MTSQAWLNAFSVGGTILSLLGLAVAIFQIVKTRRAAEAAKLAAQQAQQSIARTVFLVDVTNCAAQLDEIKALLRARRYEAALLRVTDVTAAVTQLRGMTRTHAKQPLNFKQALTQLGILRDLLELRLHEENTPINPVKINEILSGIADSLNRWIGSNKYLAAAEDNADG